MKFDFLRGACVIIEGAGKRVLCDPWLTDDIYYGSWAHYPPFTEWDRIGHLDYIYVSHIHPDHFSPETMKRLPKVPVLIHRFNSKFLKQNIENLGFEVIELEHNKTHDLDGLKITIFAADDCNPRVCGRFFGCDSLLIGDTQIDSLAVFEADGQVYVNANDCPYQLSRHTLLPKIRLQYPEIDLLFVAYAGAGPYPQCFVMTDRQMRLAANLKKSVFVEHAIQFAKDLRAKHTFPFAGDYVLAGRLSNLNPSRGVATLEEVYDAFDAVNVPVLRTDVPDESRRQRYVEDKLAHRKFLYEQIPVPDDKTLLVMAKEAFRRLESKRKELGFYSTTAVYLNLGAESMVRIPLHGGNISQQAKIYDTRYVRMTVDPRLLGWILAGPRLAHWNNAEIGSHITFERSPDVFERGIHHLMSFFHV